MGNQPPHASCMQIELDDPGGNVNAASVCGEHRSIDIAVRHFWADKITLRYVEILQIIFRICQSQLHGEDTL